MPGSSALRSIAPAFRGGTLGYLDYSHPIFEEFKDPRAGNFANMRFFRYRRLAAAPDDRVLARFDDGAAAMVERRVGSGRVMAFTSTLDGDWNDFPRHAMFLPLLHETVRYLAQYDDPEAWYTVGRMLDISRAGRVDGAARAGQHAARRGTKRRRRVARRAADDAGGEGAPAVELAEQGFYSVRLPGMGDRRPFTVAVNLDPAESDLTALPPTDISSAVGTASTTAAGQSLERPAPTPVDIEKQQSSGGSCSWPACRCSSSRPCCRISSRRGWD